VAETQTSNGEGVVMYSMGLCMASVCAPGHLDAEQVADAANIERPTGISSRWRVSDDPQFRTGQTNPCPCEQDSSRRHWLLSC
jgi:hypothetical protein